MGTALCRFVSWLFHLVQCTHSTLPLQLLSIRDKRTANVVILVAPPYRLPTSFETRLNRATHTFRQVISRNG